MSDDGAGLPIPPKDLAQSVEAILEQVGVPQATNPPAEEFGEAARGAGKAAGETVTAIAELTRDIVKGSIASLTYRWDQIREFVLKDIPNRLKAKAVPNERLIRPDAAVVVPALEGIGLVGDKPDLKDMYANLVASSMDSATADDVHPAFVEIIKQMTPYEAVLFRYLVKERIVPAIELVTSTPQAPDRMMASGMGIFTTMAEDAGLDQNKLDTALSNLARLGLFHMGRNRFFTKPGAYDRLERLPVVKAVSDWAAAHGRRFAIAKHHYAVSSLGFQFAKSCLDIDAEIPRLVDLLAEDPYSPSMP